MATLTWNSNRSVRPSEAKNQQGTRISDAVDRLLERYPRTVEWIKANAVLVLLLIATIFMPHLAEATF